MISFLILTINCVYLRSTELKPLATWKTALSTSLSHPQDSDVLSVLRASVLEARASRWLSGKECACQCRRPGFDPWVGKIPWRRKWQPTAVVLPGESQGQRSPSGCSPRGCKRVRHNRACIHVLEAKDAAQGCRPGETISPEGGQRGGDHHVLVPQELSQCCRKPLRDRPREPFASSPGLLFRASPKLTFTECWNY